MNRFSFNDSPLHQKFEQKDVIFKSIQSEMESFGVQRIVIDKITDALLIYGEGFHIRLAQILKSCDERQHSSKRPRSAIINKLLSKPSADEGPSFTFYKDKTCKLALSTWTMFLRIIQFCVLSNSKASGHISNKEKIPQIEIECLINDFLDKSKAFENESIDLKKKLHKEINDCKQNIQNVMKQIIENKEIEQSIKQKIDEIKSRTHKKAILSNSLKQRIMTQNIEKKKVEYEVSEWNKECVVLQIRSDQLCKKREITKKQIERLQVANKDSSIKIEEDIHECGHHKHRFEYHAEAITKHEVKMKQKNEELDVFRQHHGSVQEENLDLKHKIAASEEEKSELCKENEALNLNMAQKQNKLTTLTALVTANKNELDQKQRVFGQINDELIAIIKRRDEAKDSLHKVKLELDDKIAALASDQHAFKNIDDEIEAAKTEIIKLEQTELNLTNECESRMEKIGIIKADIIRLDEATKKQRLEVKEIAEFKISHLRQMDDIQDELEIIRDDITKMNVDCNALQSKYDEHELFVKTDFEKSEKKIEEISKKTDEVIEEVHDCKAQLSEMNDKIYCNEKRRCEILAKVKMKKSHFEQLTEDKKQYETNYNELMKQYKTIKLQKNRCDAQIKKFEMNVQRESIDTNEWKTKIYSETEKFEEMIEILKERIKQLETRQSIVENTMTNSDRLLEMLQREHEGDIASLQKQNKQKISLLEIELDGVKEPSESDRNTMMLTLKDEIEHLEKMIIQERDMSRKSQEEINQINAENIELSKDYDITMLCKEHLIKEQKDLDEYQCKLQQKMGSLMEKLDDERQKDVGTQTLGNGLFPEFDALL